MSYILLTGKHPFFEPDTTKMFIRVAAGDYQFKPEDWRNTSTDAKVGYPAAGGGGGGGTCFVSPIKRVYLSCLSLVFLWHCFCSCIR